MADHDKLAQLVDWDNPDALPLVQQLAARVREHTERGDLVGVVTCFVWRENGTLGISYDVGYSPLPQEVILWAANHIRRKIENNEGST